MLLLPSFRTICTTIPAIQWHPYAGILDPLLRSGSQSRTRSQLLDVDTALQLINLSCKEVRDAYTCAELDRGLN